MYVYVYMYVYIYIYIYIYIYAITCTIIHMYKIVTFHFLDGTGGVDAGRAVHKRR